MVLRCTVKCWFSMLSYLIQPTPSAIMTDFEVTWSVLFVKILPGLHIVTNSSICPNIYSVCIQVQNVYGSNENSVQLATECHIANVIEAFKVLSEPRKKPKT